MCSSITVTVTQPSLFPDQPDKDFWDNFNPAPSEMQTPVRLGWPYDPKVRGIFVGSHLLGNGSYEVIVEVDGAWYAFHPFDVYPVC